MSHDGRDVLVRTNQKIRKGRRQRIKRRALFVLLLVIVLVSLMSYIAHRPSVRVATVSVSGTETLSPYDVEKVVSTRLAGKFLFLFPRNTIFFISKRSLEKELIRTYPRIETIDVSIDKQELQVFLSERTASYLWCDAVPFKDVTEKLPCYYFDATGFIFDSAPYFSATIYFTVYDEYVHTEGASPIGNYILHKNDVGPLLSFVASLETLNIHGFALALSDNIATLYLGKLKDSQAPQIIWNIDDDLARIGGNLQAALSIQPMKSDVFGGAQALDYIDLRYSDKVYYKMKKETYEF